MTIKKIFAREILDSRGNPTVEVDVYTEKGLFRASVPSGASTGRYEAKELRDCDMKRYMGKGVKKACENINNIIAKKLIGQDESKQEKIDKIMIELDNSKDKSRLGANSILALSMAAARAGAGKNNLTLYKYIAEIYGNKRFALPVPFFNVINGGVHAGNKLAIQEFMIAPVGADNFKEGLRIATETYHTLKGLIKEKYGISNINIGDEGGFAPNIETIEEALNLLIDSIKKAGYTNKIKIALDCAASEFYDGTKYNLGFKSLKKELKSGIELIDYYKNLIRKYGIISIEDPFSEDDWNSYEKFNKELGKKIQIVGDDLLVTNPVRIKIAIEKKACNSLLLKINQIGTISEAIESAKLARRAGFKIMVSHRSGETEDNFIADFAVGINAEEIKSGAPARGERLSKYNQLLRIAEELGKNA